jgi:hypothetical protein
MAGRGRAPIAAAADIGNASRGNLRESEELTDDADRGLPTRGDRMANRNKRTARAERTWPSRPAGAEDGSDDVVTILGRRAERFQATEIDRASTPVPAEV